MLLNKIIQNSLPYASLWDRYDERVSNGVPLAVTSESPESSPRLNETKTLHNISQSDVPLKKRDSKSMILTKKTLFKRIFIFFIRGILN